MNGLIIFAGAAFINISMVLSFRNRGLAATTRAIASLSGLSLKGGSNSDISDWPQTGNPHILITGGAGYIGTHTIVGLLEAGYDVTVVDNLVNANEESLRRVRTITSCAPTRLRN